MTSGRMKSRSIRSIELGSENVIKPDVYTCTNQYMRRLYCGSRTNLHPGVFVGNRFC
jgi:hypothetical protein